MRALRIEVTSHPSLPNNGPGLTNYEGPIGGFFMSEFQAFQGGKRVQVARAEDTNEDEDDKINDSPVAAAKAKPKAAAKAKKKNNAQATLDGEMSSGWQVLGGYGVQHAAVLSYFLEAEKTPGQTTTIATRQERREVSCTGIAISSKGINFGCRMKNLKF